MVIARKQTLVQLNDHLLSVLDRESARRGISRSALIREAVKTHLHDESRDEISRQIVEGYRRFPEDDWELEMAGENAIELIEEEPW